MKSRSNISRNAFSLKLLVHSCNSRSGASALVEKAHTMNGMSVEPLSWRHLPMLDQSKHGVPATTVSVLAPRLPAGP